MPDRVQERAPDTARTLVLLRHAKSGYPGGVGDHERPLADRGRRDAPVVGAWLAGQGLRPDLVLCSDAVRARQTWDLASAALGGDLTTRLEPRLYETSADAVLDLLAELPDDVRTLLVVGHQPATSDVAAALAGEGSDGDALARLRAKFPTAGVAVLRLDRPWTSLAAGACRLESFTVPRG